LIGLCLITFNASAQSRKDLEDQRARIIKEIQSTQLNLKAASDSKNKKLNELNALEDKINNRQKLLTNISTSLQLLNKEISQNDSTLIRLAKNIDEIKVQYNQLIRYSYLKKLSSNKWSYILSSKNLNDAFLRWRYTKQFEQYCMEKARELAEIEKSIDSKNMLLKENKIQQEKLLKDESQQLTLLSNEKNQQKKLVKELSSEESKLKKTLDQQKSEREKLNKAIEDAILKELSKKEKTVDEAAKKREIILSDAFSDNRGDLPWPINKGTVKSKFGIQPHPTIPGLKIDNNGIDIEATVSGAEVTSIYKGKVIGITAIPGYDNMVIIQHGDYYTVYSKLSSVAVSTDQEVTTGQLLGRLASDKNELHVELWKKKSKIDPLKWLSKR
jgi:septal ring factor EnvC (AmiA/AmiB activator)